MQEGIQVCLDVWVHNGDKPSWDWFNITGERIHVSLIEHLSSDDRQNDLDIFDDLEKDQAYTAIVLFSWEEGDSSVGIPSGWYIESLLAYQRIPNLYDQIGESAEFPAPDGGA